MCANVVNGGYHKYSEQDARAEAVKPIIQLVFISDNNDGNGNDQHAGNGTDETRGINSVNEFSISFSSLGHGTGKRADNSAN